MTAGDLSKYAAQDINELEQAAARLPSFGKLAGVLGIKTKARLTHLQPAMELNQHGPELGCRSFNQI